MISDSAGHAAKNWADYPQEERASVFQLKELSFLPPLFFFLFSSTVNVWLSGQMHEESQNDSYHLSLLLAARLADRSCLSWDREGLCSFHTSLFRSPSVSSINPFGHIKNRHPLKSTSRNKNANTTAHGNKRVKTEKKNQKQVKGKKRREKKLLLSI